MGRGWAKPRAAAPKIPRMKTHPTHAGFASRRLACSLVALTAIWLFACGARPNASPEPAASETVRVATSGDYAPFSIWPENAEKPRGFSPELLRSWSRATGRRIEWVRFTWPELIEDARAGRFDLAASGITVRPDRSVVGTFSVPLARTSAVVLVSSPKLTLGDLNSAKRRIAVNRGGHLERVARERFPKAEIVPTSPNEAVPGLLARDEVDAVVTDTRESPVWRDDHPDWLQLGPLTLDRKAVFAAPGQTELLAELDAWLETPRGRRALLDLQQNELGIDPVDAYASVVAAIVAAVDERLALMPYVALYKRAHDLPIAVPEREAVVLDAAWRAVSAEAARQGVAPPDETRVRAFYRTQIEAAKAIQQRVEADDDAKPPYDLETELRPALLRIGDRMAFLIVALEGDTPHGIEMQPWGALARYGLDEAQVAAIKDALDALAPDSKKGARSGSLF